MYEKNFSGIPETLSLIQFQAESATLPIQLPTSSTLSETHRPAERNAVESQDKEHLNLILLH